MPDKFGLLSKEEYETARNWLNEHANSSCPICDGTQWTLVDHVVSLSATGSKRFDSKMFFPALLVVCRSCGYFRLHSSMKAGIVKYEDDSEAGVDDVT